MSGEPVHAILDELREELDELMTAHGFACMGLRRLRDYLASMPERPENPDQVIDLASVVPDNPDWPKNRGWLPDSEWRLSEAEQQVQNHGSVETLLGRQWIVSVYALWDEEYRPRLAEAHGRSKAEEVYPLLGDLRRLRNDVIHHRGIASVDNTGHCEVVKWFQPGEVIRVDGEHFGEFLRLFPWSQMATGT